MVAAITRHPLAGRLLDLEGECEASVRWTDEATGVKCKARGDKWIPSKRWLVDVKTARDASSRGFAKACANFRYHVQDAHYSSGFGADAFMFVVVEKEPPYAVGVYQLDADSRERGRELRAEALETLAQCVEKNTWPGYPAKVIELRLPDWAMGEWK